MNNQFAVLQQAALTAATTGRPQSSGNMAQNPDMSNLHRQSSSPHLGHVQTQFHPQTIITSWQAAQLPRTNLPHLTQESATKIVMNSMMQVNPQGLTLTVGNIQDIISNMQQFRHLQTSQQQQMSQQIHSHPHPPLSTNPSVNRNTQAMLQQVMLAQTRAPSASPYLPNVTGLLSAPCCQVSDANN